MLNREKAERIYEKLNSHGAELGSFSILLIMNELDSIDNEEKLKERFQRHDDRSPGMTDDEYLKAEAERV